MRYTKTSHFRTRHWAQLWKANIPNVQSLKDHAFESTIFVAIDAEPWSHDKSQIVEIGIAILAPVEGHMVPPTSIEALEENFIFRCHCFGVAGRRFGILREVQKKREKTYWGEEPKVVDTANVEDAIVQALQALPPRFGPVISGGKPRLCLVGYDLGFELQVLSTLYPRVLQCFSTWVDLQDLVMELASLKNRPSMAKTLFTFGFKRDSPVLRSPGVAHNAGNDSLRALSVLLNLLGYDATSTGTLMMRQDEPTRPKQLTKAEYARRLMNDNRFFEHRPKPHEAYPFAVRLYLDNHAGPAISAKRLYDTFPTYSLEAVGARRSYKVKPNEYYWVCLSSLDELNRFMAGLNGRSCDNGVWEGTWRIESHYDPSLTPATTAEELKEWLEARESAIKEQKVLARKKKENVDPADVLEDSWVAEEDLGSSALELSRHQQSSGSMT